MKRVAILVYHKNVDKIYPPEWIQRFRRSILNQTYTNYSIMELNYGGTNFRIFEESYFESFPMPNFVHALNYLLDKSFSGGYDICANTNVDDEVSVQWLEKQIPFIVSGFDIVSCNFSLVKDDMITHEHRFHNLDIKKELDRNHNVIAHPAVCYSKCFWNRNRYDPHELPLEDMLLWKRAINNGYKFKIVEDNLLYHRLHNNSIGHNLKEA